MRFDPCRCGEADATTSSALTPQRLPHTEHGQPSACLTFSRDTSGESGVACTGRFPRGPRGRSSRSYPLLLRPASLLRASLGHVRNGHLADLRSASSKGGRDECGFPRKFGHPIPPGLLPSGHSPAATLLSGRGAQRLKPPLEPLAPVMASPRRPTCLQGCAVRRRVTGCRAPDSPRATR